MLLLSGQQVSSQPGHREFFLHFYKTVTKVFRSEWTHMFWVTQCFVDKEQRTAEDMEDVAEKQGLKMHWCDLADDRG